MPSSSFAPSSVEFNGTTWSNGAGGAIRIQYGHIGEPLMDWTGADEYTQQLNVVNKRLVVRLTIRDVKVVTALGTKDTSSSGVLVIKGSTVTLTFANMVLISAEGDQGKSEYGTCILTLMHESGNGTDVPIS